MNLSAYVKFLKKLEKVTHSCIHGAKQIKQFQKQNHDIINIIKQIMTKHPKLVNVDGTKALQILLSLHVLTSGHGLLIVLK